MPDLNDLLDQVDEMRDEIVQLEQDMVRIPTVNTGFMPTGNETELCQYIEKWLADDGISSETIESAPGRGNLIARLEGTSGQRRADVHVPPGRGARGGGGKMAVPPVQRHDC